MLRPASPPPDFRSFVGTAWKSGAVPPATNCGDRVFCHSAHTHTHIATSWDSPVGTSFSGPPLTASCTTRRRQRRFQSPGLPAVLLSLGSYGWLVASVSVWFIAQDMRFLRRETLQWCCFSSVAGDAGCPTAWLNTPNWPQKQRSFSLKWPLILTTPAMRRPRWSQSWLFQALAQKNEA